MASFGSCGTNKLISVGRDDSLWHTIEGCGYFAGNSWVSIHLPRGKIISIDVTQKKQIWAVNDLNEIWRSDSEDDCSFEHIELPFKAILIQIAEISDPLASCVQNKTEVAALSTEGVVYFLDNHSKTFVKHSDEEGFNCIDLDSKCNVWGCKRDGSLYMAKRDDKSWEGPVPTPSKVRFIASGGSDLIWYCGKDQKIYMYEEDSKSFVIVNSIANAIDLDANPKGNIYIINKHGQIFSTSPRGIIHPYNWKNSKTICLGNDDSIWKILDGTYFQYKNNSWVSHSNLLDGILSIDVETTSKTLWIITSCGQVIKKSSSGNEFIYGLKTPTAAKKIKISPNGTALILGVDKQIYRYDSAGNVFRIIRIYSDIEDFDVDPDDCIWVVLENGEIWKKNIGEVFWKGPLCDHGTAKKISCSPQGPYIINDEGKVFWFDIQKSGFFHPIDALQDVISSVDVDSKGILFAMKENGDVICNMKNENKFEELL